MTDTTRQEDDSAAVKETSFITAVIRAMENDRPDRTSAIRTPCC